MAEEGLAAEDEVRGALRHGADGPRVVLSGIAAGVAGAAIFALGLHLLWHVVRSVMNLGDRAVLSGRLTPPPLSLMTALAYAHAVAALLVSLLWTAGVLAALVAVLTWVRRSANRRLVEFPVAVIAGLTFAVTLDIVERAVGALSLVHPAPLTFGGGFFGLVTSPILAAIYFHSPLAFVALGWSSGPLSLAWVLRVGATYSAAALIAAVLTYAARRIGRGPSTVRPPPMM